MGEVIFAQLACPFNGIIFCFHREWLTYLLCITILYWTNTYNDITYNNFTYNDITYNNFTYNDNNYNT